MTRRSHVATLAVAVGVLALTAGMLQGSAFAKDYTPGISSVKPAKAEVGDAVIIRGSHFTGITAVQFNGINAVFTVTSSKKIQATVPAGATTGSVSVLTATQTVTKPSIFTVLSDAPFVSCLTSGSATVPAGTEPYIGAGWVMFDQSFVKPFLKSTTTTLTVNGNAVKDAYKFWDKHGQASLLNWGTYWGYDPGIVLAKAGDTMTLAFHVVATKTFTDGFTTYKPATELFPGPTCILHAI